MPRTNAVVYKDFDISFTTHPVTRKLNVLKNDLAVARSVKNLILTNKNERPYQLNVGSNVRNRLFEPADSFTGQKIRSDITECIQNFEPRAQLLQVLVAEDLDRNGYNISIKFRTINQSDPVQLTFLIQRVR